MARRRAAKADGTESGRGSCCGSWSGGEAGRAMASFSDPPATTAPSLTAIRVRARARDLATRLAQPRYLAAAAAAAPLIGLAFLRFGAGAEFAVAAFVIPTLCLL